MKITKQVRSLVTENMRQLGWPALNISDLPEVFAREQQITGFFDLSNIRRSSAGSYVLEGGFGVLHRGFEAEWVQLAERKPQEPGFGMYLHTANFPELNNVRYLQSLNQEDLGRFCAKSASVIALAPNDVDELKQMVACGRLLNHPLDAFAGYSHRMKHEAFMAFLRELAR